MKNGLFSLNSIILGGLAAGLSVVIVLGSLLLAFTEGGRSPSIESFPTIESVSIFTPTEVIPTTTAYSPTITPTRTPPPTPTAVVLLEVTEAPEICDYPIGWLPYTIKRSDTLNRLSAATGLSPQQLADANCLMQSQLTPDSILYLPPASPTSPPVTCGPPRNWVTYYVLQGDTLFDIAQRVNSNVSQLKSANCLKSNDIRTGQILYVPYPPAPRATPTIIIPTQAPPLPTSTQVPLPTPTEGFISHRPPPYPYPPP